jgi:hypothetical protein
MTERIAWLDSQFASEESITESLFCEYSSQPYTKSDDKLPISLTNAKADVLTTVGQAVADGYVFASQDVDVTVSVGDEATVTLSVYVNGLKEADYNVTEDSVLGRLCTFTISKEKLTEETGTKNVISIIGRDSDGNKTYTNFATVIEAESESAIPATAPSITFRPAATSAGVTEEPASSAVPTLTTTEVPQATFSAAPAITTSQAPQTSSVAPTPEAPQTSPGTSSLPKDTEGAPQTSPSASTPVTTEMPQTSSAALAPTSTQAPQASSGTSTPETTGEPQTSSVTPTSTQAPQILTGNSSSETDKASSTTTSQSSAKSTSTTVTTTTKKVSITVKLNKKTIKKKSIVLKKGTTYQLTAIANVAGKISYRSLNKKVVTISSKGKLIARKKGTTHLIVKCKNTKVKIKIKVKG